MKYGAFALVTYAAIRTVGQLPKSQPTEDALDQVNEGLDLRRNHEELNAAGRLRRIISLSKTGRGVEIDATALIRVRLRKVT
jgi:hypothetical protein|tara:strand:+ start:166 stop:411 length:246 start_codon:yes stop_codon:yes gene_type:complete